MRRKEGTIPVTIAHLMKKTIFLPPTSPAYKIHRPRPSPDQNPCPPTCPCPMNMGENQQKEERTDLGVKGTPCTSMIIPKSPLHFTMTMRWA